MCNWQIDAAEQMLGQRILRAVVEARRPIVVNESELALSLMRTLWLQGCYRQCIFRQKIEQL